MALNMRRAKEVDIDAVPAEECTQFIVGLPPHAPDDASVLHRFYDSWVEAHYFFTGDWQDNSLPGGFILGGEDWHSWHPQHEPTKVLNTDAVKDIARHLSGLSPDIRSARLDRMTSGTAGLPKLSHPDDIPFIAPTFDEVIAFVQTAANRNEAIVKDIG